jgi:hypothetical protein
MAVSAALGWSVGGGCRGTSLAPATDHRLCKASCQAQYGGTSRVTEPQLHGWQLIVHGRRIASLAGWQAASAG